MNAGEEPAADDPYLAAGLVRNPFVAEQSPGVADAVFLDLGLDEPPSAGVVELVGCRGAGKTTTLLRWCRARDGVYHHVERGLGRLVPPPQGPVVAWDEVDRLSRAVLRVGLARARRREGLVLLGSHELTGLADRSVPLPVPTVATVLRFAALRIDAARLPGVGGAPLRLPTAEVDRIVSGAGGSWRRVGSALHVWAAVQVGVSPPLGRGAGATDRPSMGEDAR